MSTEIIVEHSAVEIEYNEYQNKWIFEVNGKRYELASLKESRAKIDEVIKAVKLKQRKQFEPVSVFGHSLKHGRITSIVGRKKSWRSSDNGGEILEVKVVWDDEKGASNHEISILYGDTPYNRATIELIKEHQQEIKRLGETLTGVNESELVAEWEE